MHVPAADASASFLLVPGAGGSGWYWHRVVAELVDRGHDAVAVDLPAADDAAGLDAYVDVIMAAAAKPERIVLVAQSMAGLSAPLVCVRRDVELLVLVNAMIPRPGESGGQWWEATGQPAARLELAARQARVVGPEVDLMEDLLHDVPDDVVAELRQHEAPQSFTPFTEPFPLDRWPDVPTRVLAGRDDRFFPPDFQRRVAESRLGITPDEVPGGHLLALSRPRELVDHLEACLAAR